MMSVDIGRIGVAEALCADCVEILGLGEGRLDVEFTRHPGDGTYHPARGGFGPGWPPDER